ncbi:MAG: PA2779 family protein [Pseudomonadota bacterium]
MIQRLQRTIAQLLIVSLMATAPLAPARAGIVGTGEAMALSQRAETEARVNAVLMREDVQAQLEALGVAPEQATDRVASLTDSELAALDAKLDELPAGGSVLGVLGAVLVVLIVLELLGVTNVFTSL